MAYLDWNPAFETGIPGIDYDHRRLVGLLNDIDAMIRDEVESQDVAAALAELHALATAHFALEEKIMRDQKYAGLAGRQQIHYQLLDEVREVMDAYEDGSSGSGGTLPGALRQWLGKAMDIDVGVFAGVSEAGLRTRGLSRS